MKRIRLTKPSDAQYLPDIERSAGEAFRSLPDLAWIADDAVQSVERHLELIAAGCSWVAVDESDRPIGFLSAERQIDNLHIWELAVRHSAQGRGLGRALIEASLRWAREHQIAAVTLTTFRDVPWNEPFYRRLGFTTLTPDALTDRLRGILEKEITNGLPAEKRCAMLLALR